MCTYLQMLRENQVQGNNQLTQLRELCGVVSNSTASKGIEILEKEVEDLENSLKEHLSSVGKYILIKILLFESCRYIYSIYILKG